MKSLNRCTFIGNLVRDPEARAMGDGTAVTKLTIAVNDSYTNAGGQKVERAEFVPLVAFGKLGEICAMYLKKGQQVYVEGAFTTRSYDKDGEKRYTTEVKLENMQMLGKKDDASSGYSAPQRQPAARPAPRQPQQSAPHYEDDIPF